MGQIRLTTERLTIQESYDVVPEHVEWLNDKELMQWSEQRWMEHTTASQHGFLYQAAMDHDPLVFDIRLKDGPTSPGDDTRKMLSLPAMNAGATIGNLHAHIDHRHKRADLGIMIGPQYHRKGYATEAWKAVEKHLIEELKIEKFEGGCMLVNRPMEQLFRRLGYRAEGLIDGHFTQNVFGERQGLLKFGKLVR